MSSAVCGLLLLVLEEVGVDGLEFVGFAYRDARPPGGPTKITVELPLRA